MPRYDAVGAPEDLDEAILLGQQALNGLDHGHPQHATQANNLSLALRARFERTHAIDALDQAIELAHDAVRATPAGHPDCAGRLSNLATALHLHATATGHHSEADDALRLWQDAASTSTSAVHVRLGAASRWGAVAAERQD